MISASFQSSAVRRPIGRRDFVKGLSLVAAGFACGVTPVSGFKPFSRRRYAIVDADDRSRIFREAILGAYRDKIVLADVMHLSLDSISPTPRRPVEELHEPFYSPGAFEKMLQAEEVDVVIVSLPAVLNHEYVVRALNADCEVVTQGRLGTTMEDHVRISEAGRRAGRRVRVARPHGYLRARKQVKDLLVAGEIGNLLSVDFNLRRSVSEPGETAGEVQRLALDAESCFDLLNWWIGKSPSLLRSVLRRSSGTAATIHLQTSYTDGVRLSYAEKTCETGGGYRVAFNGTKGRLEHSMEIGKEGRGSERIGGGFGSTALKTSLMSLRGAVFEFTIESADRAAEESEMLADLFSFPSIARSLEDSGHLADLGYARAMALAAEGGVPAGEGVEIQRLLC